MKPIFLAVIPVDNSVCTVFPWGIASTIRTRPNHVRVPCVSKFILLQAIDDSQA